MAAEIDLHPRTDRGDEILDELEQRTKIEPERREDGTRRYYLNAEDADVHAFDPMLDKIASDWREHITNWRLN